MKNFTAGVVIVPKEPTGCTMDSVDHVLQEHLTMHQVEFALQFVPMEPFGPTPIKNACVPQTNLT